MNITCDVRIEYTASERQARKWREAIELSLNKDDWNHNIIVVGSKSKKSSFKLDGNIKQIHTSNISEGKITITLITPIVNIFVRNALLEQLNSFVRLLAYCKKHSGDDLEEVAERWGIVKRREPEPSSSEDESADADEEG